MKKLIILILTLASFSGFAQTYKTVTMALDTLPNIAILRVGTQSLNLNTKYVLKSGDTMTGGLILKPSTSSSDFSSGIRFPDNPSGGIGDVSGIRLFNTTNEGQTLEIYVGNDANDIINFRTQVGGVGDNNLVKINDNTILNAGNVKTVNGNTILGSGDIVISGNAGTVTNVSALTLGTTGTDLNSTVANPTTTPVITLNVPTASATNRGVLSSTDWSAFNAKQNAITLTTTGTSGASTLIGATLNVPQYAGTTYTFGTGLTNTANNITIDGTVATLTGTQTLTNKSISGGQITSAVTNATLAATVTTNANLTGIVTSTGNATSIADAALSIAKTSGLQTALDLKSDVARQYGQLYNKNTWTALTDFTTNGATATVTSNKIVLSGNINDYIKSLDLNGSSLLSNWKQTIRYKVPAISGTSYGIGVGMRSANTYGNSSIVARIGISTDGATSGKVYIYQISGATVTLVATVNAGTALSATAGDIIELKFERHGLYFTAKAMNLSTSSTNSYTASYQFDTNPPFVPNTGNFAMFQFGGSNEVQSYFVQSNETRKAEFLVIGDSKTLFNSASVYSKAYVSILNDYVNNGTSLFQVENSGGGNDRTTEVLLRVNEIISLAPKKVLMAIGSNDMRSGTTLATWQTNYSSIVTQLTAAGIDVYHLLPFPENSSNLNLSTYVTYINSTYSVAKIIDTNTPLLGTAPYINASFTTDGVHPNDAGMVVIANTIIKSSLLDVFVNYSADPQDIPINRGGGKLIESIGIGRFALQGNTTGLYNAGIGFSSLQNNSTGSYNAAIGYQTLKNNTTGSFNSAVGITALQANTTGTDNSGIGAQSLYNNTTGIKNTGVGTNTLFAATTATENTAVGYFALRNTTSSNNTAIGSNAAGANTSGSYNTAIGQNALAANTTGGNNVVVGPTAMQSSNSSFNVAMGVSSLFSLSSGANNVGIGYWSLLGTTSGGSNTALGYRAGRTATTASGGVYIGNEAGFYETASNKLHIGNNINSSLINGDFSTNTVNLSPAAAPGIPTLTGSTIGGTLPAGTYFYGITALNVSGETILGTQASVVTTGSTSSVSLTWTAVTGATSYRIYRGTTLSGQNLYYTSTTNSFTDINGSSTAATPPNVNTAYNFNSNSGGVTTSQYKLSALNTAPSSATDTGIAGEIRITASFIYVCTATNTWVRTALTTW